MNTQEGLELFERKLADAKFLISKLESGLAQMKNEKQPVPSEKCRSCANNNNFGIRLFDLVDTQTCRKMDGSSWALIPLAESSNQCPLYEPKGRGKQPEPEFKMATMEEADHVLYYTGRFPVPDNGGYFWLENVLPVKIADSYLRLVRAARKVIDDTGGTITNVGVGIFHYEYNISANPINELRKLIEQV